MYPRNAASPERIAIGAVVQISDGAVQTSGVSIKVKPQGSSASAGGGTTSYEEGIVEYLPTQAETNYTAFEVIAYKTGCIPVAVTVVTTASATPGTVLLAPVTHTSAVVPTVTTLTGHTAQTGDAFARLGAPAGASVSADVAAVKSDSAGIKTKTDSLTFTVANVLDANTLRVGGTAQTARDIGASVLLSPGTGTGQISLSSGLVTLAGVTHTGAVIPTVTTLTGHTAQTGDSYARIGSAGAGLSALPWNAAWDAEVQSEAADALAAYGAATATDVTTAAANVSVDEIQASALADLFNTDSGTTYASAVAGSVVAEIADNAGGSALTEAGIADAVWNEAMADHLTSGTTGASLNGAGSAGDPWTTALPGAYGSGTAGKIIGDNINATISSRLAAAGYTAPLDAAGTRTAVGLASANLDTQLAAAATVTAGSIRSAVGLASANMDTQLAAIVADTGELQTDWANGGRLDLILDARASQASVDDVPTATENADALLNRDMSAVSDTNARSPLNALRFLRNKWSLSGTTLTVTEEDDTTAAWTATVTTNAGADPITGSDPA